MRIRGKWCILGEYEPNTTMKAQIKPDFEIKELPQPPPYHIVFIPRVDSSELAQASSFNLAMQLSMIRNREYNIEIVDFEDRYTKFISPLTTLPEEMNELFFIKESQAMFFKAGVIVFVTNFDMNDFVILMTIFRQQKPDIKVLLVVTESQFDNWRLADRDDDIECCIHNHSVTTTMMQKLKMTTTSH